MKHTFRPSTSDATPKPKEEQLSTESSDNRNNDTPSGQSNPLRINDTEDWIGKSIIIVGAPPRAKAGALAETSVQQESQFPTESSDATRADTQSEQSNPLRINDTKNGRVTAIIGAPPPPAK